jgi:hypothetical protein
MAEQQVSQPALGPLKSLEQAKNAATQHPQQQRPQQQHQKQELELADIHMPTTPSAWPPAPGWWVLLALIVALITLAVVKFLRYKKLKTQQQRTLQALTLLEDNLLNGDEEKKTEALSEINILLRRLALMHFPRKNIASLTGKNWLQFLDKSGNTKDFSQGAGRILADVPYLARMPDSANLLGLTQVIKKWVKQISLKSINHKNTKSKGGRV